jgi:hypothetical protein
MLQAHDRHDMDCLPPRPNPVIYSNPQIRQDAYYTPSEAAALTRLSEREFRRWVAEPQGPIASLVAGAEKFLGAALLRAQQRAEVSP